MQGWVKLHRSLQRSAIASHPEYLAVWVHLLMRASHKPREAIVGRSLVALNSGDLVFGRKKFSAETGVSENKVRGALDVLKRLNQITIKSHAKFSVISITKWAEYQEESPAKNQQTASNAPAPSQHLATDKNVDNAENGENGKKQPPKNKFSDEDMRCAEYLLATLKSDQPDVKQPNLKSWADTVRLMRERDSRTHRDICSVWKWSRSDPFWQQNILSASKLREKYDQLNAKMRSNHGNQPAAAKSAIERFMAENYSEPQQDDQRSMGGDDSVVWEQVDQPVRGED